MSSQVLGLWRVPAYLEPLANTWCVEGMPARAQNDHRLCCVLCIMIARITMVVLMASLACLVPPRNRAKLPRIIDPVCAAMESCVLTMSMSAHAIVVISILIMAIMVFSVSPIFQAWCGCGAAWLTR
jgi:hypothetical protein